MALPSPLGLGSPATGRRRSRRPMLPTVPFRRLTTIEKGGEPSVVGDLGVRSHLPHDEIRAFPTPAAHCRDVGTRSDAR